MARHCKGTNKAGEPCGVAPQKGKDWCRAHDPALSGVDRFGSPEQAATANPAGMPRTPKPLELMRQRAEDEAERLVGAYFDSLSDPDARLKAADAILDRLFGRPKQATELSGPEGGAIPAEVTAGAIDPRRLSREQRAALREMLDGQRD